VVPPEPDWTRLFEDVALLQRGHFLLSSGRHSSAYIQVAQLLQYPDLAARALGALAGRFAGRGIEVVAGPAIGAVIIAYEVARSLHARAIWTERVDERMVLRRSLRVQPGERALVVEDVITTGGSAREVRDILAAAGAVVVGFAALVDRRGESQPGDLPVEALVRLPLPVYAAAHCPLCAEGAPLMKPGSRVAAR
jgi:orotate phosphoribosyltransferase